MNEYTIRGTAMHLELNGCTVNNYGTIMHLDGDGNTVNNQGTIMHNDGARVASGGVRVVYRDRYVTDPQAKEKVQRLEAELEDTKKKLAAANRETRRLSQRIREMEIAPKRDERLQHVEELLQCALEVNHEQTLRIRELERGVCDAYLRQQIDPWDMKPTKEQCARLLKMFQSFTDLEDEV